jgi:poly-gamma-glutamate synthesis protein (capsule biosynthesis protein)
VNLEAPVTDFTVNRENKKYNLKIPRESLQLFDDRFVLSLANNHIMDFGSEGLEDTIASLKDRGIRFAGAGKNLEDAAKPEIIENGDLAVGIICAADPRYQPAGAADPGTNPAEPAMLKESLRDLRPRVDVILVSLHIGMEFTPVPTPFMTSLAEICLSEGASVVQFHHAHCISGYSIKEGKVVLWGTGNYAFPRIIPKLYRQWSRSAVWKVILDSEGRISREITAVPVVISDDGFPCRAVDNNHRDILETISSRTRKLNDEKKYPLWRLTSVLSLGYLRVSLSNYFDITRRGGIRALIDTVASSLNVLFRRTRR